MRRYTVEFIGTFFLVLTIGCTGLAAAPGVIAPLAIGSVLMAMIYAGGHISGAHYNPAVTLGVFLRGRCPASDLLPYWGAQLLGAACAALIVGLALRGAPVTPLLTPKLGAFLAEFLFTFALVYVVLNRPSGGNGRGADAVLCAADVLADARRDANGALPTPYRNSDGGHSLGGSLWGADGRMAPAAGAERRRI